MKFSNPLGYIADLAFPRVCIACGRRLYLRERHLCAPCLADLPRTRWSSVSRNPMADRLNERFDDGPYAYATALFFYRGNYVGLTKALKFHRNFALGGYLAALLAEEIKAAGHFSDVDLVTCVPLHWTRRFRRGYNQSEVIARELAGALGVRFEDILYRKRRTSRQAKITGSDKEKARWRNVSGAFAVRKRNFPENCRHILVVDDVFTTGATLYACYNTIKTATNGEIRISIATLAYAGGE